jgi:hypothetical protein
MHPVEKSYLHDRDMYGYQTEDMNLNMDGSNKPDEVTAN